LRAKGAKRTLKLAVGGAFHSPLMEPARQELEEAIRTTNFSKPVCPVYQNVTALPSTDPDIIKSNLMAQLVSPVRWTQSVLNMIADGAASFTEVGPGTVLQGLIKKINKDTVTETAAFKFYCYLINIQLIRVFI
jgi:[acyl-carrier-protein] S-malonyltransferase